MKHILVVITLLILVYSQFLNGALHVANDLPASSPEIVASFFNLPNAYSGIDSPFGSNKVSTLWSWPYNFLYGFLQVAGIGRNIQILLLGFIPITVLSVLGIWRMCSLLKISDLGKSVAVFVFLSNSYIILLIDGGQLLWALAYSFIPLCLYIFEKEITGDRPKPFRPALALLILGFFDIRAVVLFIFFLGLRITFEIVVNRLKNLAKISAFGFKFGGIYILMFTVLNMYWILPLVVGQSNIVPSQFQVSDKADFLGFSYLIHGLFLYQPHWYQNSFGQTSWPYPLFAIYPLAVFAALVLRKKDFYVAFFLLTAILGIFFSKGTQPPLGWLYQWMIGNIPGFFIFRDPSKFFTIICLAYSLLIAVTISELENKPQINSLLKYSLILLAILPMIFLTAPVISGKTSGLLSRIQNEQIYVENGSFLENNDQYSRVLWIPAKPPAGFSDFDHPAVNASDLVPFRPFASGIKGTYETINYLREASYSGELLDISGIGYLAYPPLDPKKEYKPDQILYHRNFLNQLRERDWIAEEIPGMKFPLLKTRSNRQPVFLAENTYFVVGPDSIYNEATKSSSLKLSENALIFTDEYPEIISDFSRMPSANLILYESGLLDLAALFIPKKDLIFPASQLRNDPDESGWWKRDRSDFIHWKDFLLQKYGVINQDFDLGGGWAVGEGNLNLKIKTAGIRDNHLLLARVLESSRGGKLAFYTAGVETGSVETLNNRNKFSWREVGEIKQDSPTLEVKSKGSLNVINALSIISKADWQEMKSKSEALKSDGRITDLNKTSGTYEAPDVVLTKLNESKYTVTISGLKKPELLVFSRSYDPGWSLAGEPPVRTYSIFNGFPIDKNGTFILEYKPQRFVEAGSLVSLVSLILFTAAAIFYRFKKNGYRN